MSWVHQIDLARRLREEALALRGESARARAEAELARTAARKVRRSEILGNPSELHPPRQDEQPHGRSEQLSVSATTPGGLKWSGEGNRIISLGLAAEPFPLSEGSQGTRKEPAFGSPS